MRIRLDDRTEPALFFTAGNLPSQLAYGLTHDQVAASFVVALLRSPRVLLAGSYFFESESTRRLVGMFPQLWQSHAGKALFFLSTGYPTFRDHGTGKIAKSPSTFTPYSDPEVVRDHAATLDGLGVVGVRADVDVSDAIVVAWCNSCLSDEDDGIGSHLHRTVGHDAPQAISACIELARQRRFDFIWPSIEPAVAANPILASSAPVLRRKLADLYAATMALTLGAIESSPSLALDHKNVTVGSVGHLGMFADVLAMCGLNPTAIKDEDVLLRMLQMEELVFLRRMDEIVIRTAVDAGHAVSEYWNAIRATEGRARRAHITHSQLRRTLEDALRALGVEPTKDFTKGVLALEKVHDGQLLNNLGVRFEELLARQGPKEARPNRFGTSAKDVVLLASASPSIAGLERLALEVEQRAIMEALDAQRDRGGLRLELLPAVEFSDLQLGLQVHRPRFLQFSGHGSPSGAVFLSGAGDSVELSPLNLRRLLELTHRPECIVLNACYSAAGAEEIGKVVKYAILMSDRIEDEDAAHFTASFYAAISSGLPLQRAFDLAVLSLQVERPNEGDPVLSLYIDGLPAVASE